MRFGRARSTMAALSLAGCGTAPPPPPNFAYAGLPVTGDRAFAESLGFRQCNDTYNARHCRKEGVRLMGQGPYSAEVDLRGSEGSEGFHEVALWHERDQRAVYAVGKALAAQGWTVCRTGLEDRGDQEIWTRPGATVRFSIDISFWRKRRVRILPETGEPLGHCWR